MRDTDKYQISAHGSEVVKNIPLLAYQIFSSSEMKHSISPKISSFWPSGRMTDCHDLDGRAMGENQTPWNGLHYSAVCNVFPSQRKLAKDGRF